MTRVNVGVDPRELPGPLLLAEHREITRIPNAVHFGVAKFKNLPDTFRLGPGHVKFFYLRLGYLRARYDALLGECRRRGYQVTDKSSAFDDLPPSCMGSYAPTPADRALIVERIREKGYELLPLTGDET